MGEFGDIAESYCNEGLGTYEEFESETMRETTNIGPNGEELRVFVVCYGNGNLHSTTSDIEIAYHTADRIDGIVGELANVHKPLKETDIPEPIRSAIIHSIEHPESRVTRERPVPKHSKAA